MTDKETRKTLEHCSLTIKEGCRDCPLRETEDEIECITIMSKEALNLINRYETETIALKAVIDVMREEIKELKKGRKRVKNFIKKWGVMWSGR